MIKKSGNLRNFVCRIFYEITVAIKLFKAIKHRIQKYSTIGRNEDFHPRKSDTGLYLYQMTDSLARSAKAI